MMVSRELFISSVLILLVFLSPHTSGQDEDSPRSPDVRVVIDVSGSMKRNDPNNLRQPAVDLLVQLLPEDSRAGIWTFGRWVNMLVKHGAVDQAWREDAQAKSSQINSVGLYTNIGEALEKALNDPGPVSPAHKTSIILLTDGMVDIDKDPDKNQKEWRRIVDEVLPKIRAANITVHTIALSDNADRDLLNKLSLGTDGIAEVAKSADDLMKIFLKAFDASAPSEQVPLSDEGFVIDSSVEEFTALIFREAGGEATQLVGPDQQALTAQTKSKYINWYKASNYDLITVKQPLEGQWQVVSDMAPDSRVTVVSNLNLRVKPLPNNVFRDQQLDVSFLLQEDGATIVRPEFLSLMDISATLVAGKDEFDLREIWQQKIVTNPPPQNGIFSAELPGFEKEGIYQLSIVVDGKSFIREFNHQFTTRQPFGADIKQVFNDGKTAYVLTTRSYDSELDVNKTQVVATIVSPDGRKKIRPLSPTDVDTWQATVRPDMEGEYIANIKVRGESRSGESFDISLDEIRFNYSIDKGFVEEEKEFFEEPVEATPEPTAVAEPEATPQAEEDAEGVDGEAVEEEEGDALPAWMVYAILGVGNLVLFGVGFLAFKKIMGSNKSEEILEEFSEERVEQELEAAQQEAPEEEAEEEEPPMEDLDPADDDLDPEPEPEMATPEEPEEPTEAPQDEEDIDMAPMEEEEDMAMPEMSVDEEEPALDEDPMDALDDLDQMAVDEEEKPAEELADVEDEEEEDMVSAMLKAQGLDLAEEELDDAISSLIDELENDDSFDEDPGDEDDDLK